MPDEPIVTTTCFFHVGGFYTGIYSVTFHQYFYHMFGTGFKLEHLFNTIVEKKPKQVKKTKNKRTKLWEWGVEKRHNLIPVSLQLHALLINDLS